jgi:succinyl-CoA synthetase beta subunit
MKIHEYQAKSLMKERGIPIPNGFHIEDISEAEAALLKIGRFPVVVKAQIHAGGRGKGGGVRIAKTKEEALQAASEILGMNLVTRQTGPRGRTVRKVLIEEGVDIQKELYLGITIDRAAARPIIIASEAGGMEIEELAEKHPEMIVREIVDPLLGLKSFHARRLAFSLKIEKELLKEMVSLLINLYGLFKNRDGSLVEINPLVITKDKRILALDAKMEIDENALYRHPDIAEMRDRGEEEPLEIEASQFGLNYIKLDGKVGCMVNGAGLAMATMDIIKLAGTEPANFLDVGGGASAEMVENAFRILLADKNVKAVLINIFGGILRCDVLARGVVEAISKVDVHVPVIVRLEGTNVEKGREILDNSKLDFSVAKTMQEAADMVAAAVK